MRSQPAQLTTQKIWPRPASRADAHAAWKNPQYTETRSGVQGVEW